MLTRHDAWHAWQGALETPEAVLGLARVCVEAGAGALRLDAEDLPEAFFALRTGLAGELLQKLQVYRIRLAVVRARRDDLPARFQELLREADRGAWFRFLPTREAAEAWLREGAAVPPSSEPR